MINALGQPQTLLLLGGTSDIALATARAWARNRSGAALQVIVAARPGPRRDRAVLDLEQAGAAVEAVDFEAEAPDTHPALVESVSRDRDLDVTLVAFGVLGDEEQAWQDHDAAVHLAQVNYVAPVSVGVCLAAQLKRQGHGVIVALSSVAGERVRRSNFVYGSSKAGMDGFYLGLGEALRETGARVLVVRPGFVRTKMTEGRSPAPLSVDAEDVAAAVVRGVADGDDLIWVPGAMRGVMSGLRHVPRALFRKLPL